MSSESPLAALRGAAEAVRQQLQVNGFDAVGVQRLSDFIEARRAVIKPAEREEMVTALGCFLGQCLVETYGGKWAAGPDGRTGVGIGGSTFFNPFYRVDHQLAHGSTESVILFFTGIAARPANSNGQR